MGVPNQDQRLHDLAVEWRSKQSTPCPQGTFILVQHSQALHPYLLSRPSIEALLALNDDRLHIPDDHWQALQSTFNPFI